MILPVCLNCLNRRIVKAFRLERRPELIDGGLAVFLRLVGSLRTRGLASFAAFWIGLRTWGRIEIQTGGGGGDVTVLHNSAFWTKPSVHTGNLISAGIAIGIECVRERCRFFLEKSDACSSLARAVQRNSADAFSSTITLLNMRVWIF